MATRARAATSGAGGHGHRRRHGRLHGALRRRAHRSPRRRTARGMSPPGSEWRESGVLRLTASEAMSPAFVLAALRERRARALPLPSGKDVADGLGRLAAPVVTPGDLSEAGQDESAEPATRTLTRNSRGSTAACRCQSASRSIPTPLTANQALGRARRARVLLRLAVQHGTLPRRVLGAFLSLVG